MPAQDSDVVNKSGDSGENSPGMEDPTPLKQFTDIELNLPQPMWPVMNFRWTQIFIGGA
ncbi:hypothetical protein MMC07_005577 [Pseudocyphellaria aurata]|nr:hypothetical protein [Pseudocyphellaria aurata]